jgi:ferredoxin-NADP reductase
MSEEGPVRWQTATVIDTVVRTPRIKSFFLSLDHPFEFEAGQHVDIRLTAPDGYQAMRSYSIASAPEHGTSIELAVERLDDGEVSMFMHDVIVPGDEIEVRGPLGGHFIWKVTDGGPLLLLGGGSGVVPLVSMVRHLKAANLAGSTVPVLLLLSARTWEEALFRDELQEFNKEMGGFTFVLNLTREASVRGQDFGRRIDAAMVADVVKRLPGPPLHVFICGSNAFVNAAADGAQAAGIPADMIKTERYGG